MNSKSGAYLIYFICSCISIFMLFPFSFCFLFSYKLVLSNKIFIEYVSYFSSCPYMFYKWVEFLCAFIHQSTPHTLSQVQFCLLKPAYNKQQLHSNNWVTREREGDVFSWPLFSLYSDFPNGSAGKESTSNAGDTGDAGIWSSILVWKIPRTEEPGRL